MNLQSARKQNHREMLLWTFLVHLPAWSARTAFDFLKHPQGLAAKPFSAGAPKMGKRGLAGAGSPEVGLPGHPQAFLHVQVGSRHGGESRQVIAGGICGSRLAQGNRNPLGAMAYLGITVGISGQRRR